MCAGVLPVQVSFKRRKVQLLKMLFFVPWDVMANEESLRATILKLQEDVQIELFGLATAPPEDSAPPRGMEVLRSMFPELTLKWLHIPSDLKDECYLYVLNPETTSMKMEGLQLGL